MGITPHQHRNLILDVLLSLAQFGLQYRDSDEPVINNTLQLLLHDRPDKALIGQSHINACLDSICLFTITSNILNYTPYSHNDELHQWLQHMTHAQPQIYDHDNYSPHPLLYGVEEIAAATTTMILHSTSLSPNGAQPHHIIP